MRSKNDSTIQEALSLMMDSYKLKPKLDQTKIENKWEALMGTTIAKYTKQISLRNGKLFVVLESSPLKQDLVYGKAKILKILNKELGEDIIKEVVIL